MSEPFHTRAAEIIAAYGADAARWPDAERATALHVVAASPVLTAALAEARRLDADLTAWAQAPLDVTSRAAADAAAVALRRPRPFLRWAMGTGLAASLAAGLVLLTPAQRLTPSTAPQVATAAPTTAADATAFAQVFTPTPDEDQTL
jgi:hypothetical protein